MSGKFWLVDAVINDAGLDYMKSENPDALAYDIAEAFFIFRHDYNENLPLYHKINKFLNDINFRPSPMLNNVEDLTEEGKAIYDELAKGHKFYEEKDLDDYQDDRIDELSDELEAIKNDEEFDDEESLEPIPNEDDIDDGGEDLEDEPEKDSAYDASLDAPDPEDMEKSLTPTDVEKDAAPTKFVGTSVGDEDDEEDIQVPTYGTLKLLKSTTTGKYAIANTVKGQTSFVEIPDEYVQLAKSRGPQAVLDKMKYEAPSKPQMDDDDLMENLTEMFGDILSENKKNVK